MSQLLQIVPPLPEPSAPIRRTIRREGTSTVIVVDVTGAAVCAEMPAADYHRMSPMMRAEIDGRPHVLTWCSLHGRVEIPAILAADEPLAAA